MDTFDRTVATLYVVWVATSFSILNKQDVAIKNLNLKKEVRITFEKGSKDCSKSKVTSTVVSLN